MVQLHGGGFCIGAGHIRGDNAVTVQILTGNAFQHGLRFRVQLCKAAHRKDGVQGAEQVDGTFHDQDDTITSVSMAPKGFKISTTPSTTLSTGSSRKPFQLS